MLWSGIKKTASCSPFLLGLVLGLAISYGIRILSSKTSRCQQTHTQGMSSNSNKNPIPDQIVNLDFPNFKPNEDGLKTSKPQMDRAANCKRTRSGKCGMIIDGKASTKGKNDLLFVGIMTANAYIGTRAKAVWETWAQEIPGKVVFFTGGNSYANEAGVSDDNSDEYDKRKSTVNETIPLVLLPGVDDSYPPQKKSFMMLKYMFENYGDNFEWFMRADDDMYLRSDKLEEFLRSIDSRHLYFIGQAGKGNQVEKGTLNLAHNENFCMGGPGIIMSRPTLAKVAPNVHECLQDMYSTHEDVEVGRCVQKFAGISCTWAYEMQSIFYHNSSGDHAFTGRLKRREVHRAITLHPIKTPEHLYRLHAYFQGLRIQDLLYETVLLHRDLLTFSQNRFRANVSSSNTNHPSQNFGLQNDLKEKSDFGNKFRSFVKETGLAPNLNKFLPSDESDFISWDFIMKGIYSSDTINPKQKTRGDTKEALEDVIRELMEIINGYSRVRGRVIDFKEILYGYKRINPLYGADYVLDLLMTYKKYRGKKMTVPVRRHVYIQRPFSPLQLRIFPHTGPSIVSNDYHQNFKAAIANETYNASYKERITQNLVMIVPLSGRFSTFQRFLGSFSRSCLDFIGDKDKRREKYRGPSKKNITQAVEQNFQLVVVFFGSDLEKERFQDLVNSARESLLGGEKHVLCSIKVVQIDGEFSRGKALETGISQCNEGDLLFLIDVDLAFTANVIRRVYMNTIKAKQVYFPIVFSQYNPLFQYNSSPNNLQNSRESPNTLDFTGMSGTENESFYKLGINDGYWREYGYGIAAFYKSDFRLAGGFDTSIKGWGKEDVALFERFIHQTNLTIFRAPDPALIHIFHETICDTLLPRPQYEMCIGSQANTLGSSGNLMNHIYKDRKKNRKFEQVFS